MMAAGAGFPEGGSELQRVLHASLGLEVGLPANVVVTATGFLSRSWGLTDLTASCLQLEPPSAPVGRGRRPINPFFCPSNAPVQGHAHGFELLVRRSLTERLGGLISYTLSRSVREAHFLLLDGGDAVATVPSEFDRARARCRPFLRSRPPLASWDQVRLLFRRRVLEALAGNVPVPPYNTLRDPPFFRVNVGLEKRWLLGPRAGLSPSCSRAKT